ncbi:MAG TPA: RES family NAD+ phosphorylase [Tepidisphaeraceae bacterium]|jgi:RES domain-containing protein|nr:RES family NAD+ phosphorylase [Tepidisphaeraceae bacterium]
MSSSQLTSWRIVRARYLPNAFTGEGAKRAGGRWNNRGTPLVYTAESKSLAVLEMLVHLETDEFLRHYRLIPATFDRSLITELDAADLPANWKQYPAPFSTKRIGDLWVARRESIVLKAPSVIVPGESNFLLNPMHPQFRRVQIGSPERFRFDRRLKDSD